MCLILDIVLTTEPNFSTLFTGEIVSFICDVKEGEDTDWEYEINKDASQVYFNTNFNSKKVYTVRFVSTSDGGEYQCCGRHKRSQDTKCSNPVSLNVSRKSSMFLSLWPKALMYDPCSYVHTKYFWTHHCVLQQCIHLAVWLLQSR